ncbi:L-lysine exporter family protein LysE/ArgO [Oceanisphaera litoralis]|uniref:LysE/ArgO family amino acid transporter n=1 Tax=Oceanisphaera litoralis TaxID=225144 RepID=UPI0019595707|nr:LysE/ArgO family amino acid transporter [Oceanisphaera litoralis]MBM7456532.1 L-lysine exporter family protein LysE/ArgO [Oceanisphaera litoralis]
MMYWLPWVQGFTLGAGLIIPIGAQNAFVLNQGIRRQYHLLVAAICSLFDVALISLGVFGGGAALQSHGVLYWGISLAGMAFLLLYGAHCWRRVFRQGQAVALSGRERGLKAVIIGVLAVTLLNPQVYIETVMILGSVGGGFAEREKWAFAIGCFSASLIWFFTLALAAARMSRWLNRPLVQKVMDATIGTLMWLLAAKLALGLME